MLISYLTQGKSLLPFFLLKLYFYSYTKQTEESKVKRAEESGAGGEKTAVIHWLSPQMLTTAKVRRPELKPTSPT